MFFVIGIAVFSAIGLLNTLWLFRLFSSVELFRGENEVDENSPQAGQQLVQQPAAKIEDSKEIKQTEELEKKTN